MFYSLHLNFENISLLPTANSFKINTVQQLSPLFLIEASSIRIVYYKLYKMKHVLKR